MIQFNPQETVMNKPFMNSGLTLKSAVNYEDERAKLTVK